MQRESENTPQYLFFFLSKGTNTPQQYLPRASYYLSLSLHPIPSLYCVLVAIAMFLPVKLAPYFHSKLLSLPHTHHQVPPLLLFCFNCQNHLHYFFTFNHKFMIFSTFCYLGMSQVCVRWLQWLLPEKGWYPSHALLLG